MKVIYLIIIVCLVGSCDAPGKSKSDFALLNPVIDSVNEPTEDLTADEVYTEKLILPVIGTFDLSTMKMDSLNHYGTGDCWGTIRRYSLPNIGLAIDSMTCVEYGYTYSYYLLSTQDYIEVVYVKKSESILKPESDAYFYFQQETVIDFNSEPASSMKRTDTVYEYKLRENQIYKNFVTDTLEDRQTIHKQLEMKYQEIWGLELDN